MAQDDAGAQEAYERELDEEEDIRRMDAEAAARRAQGAVLAGSAAGPSSSAAPAQSSAGGPLGTRAMLLHASSRAYTACLGCRACSDSVRGHVTPLYARVGGNKRYGHSAVLSGIVIVVKCSSTAAAHPLSDEPNGACTGASGAQNGISSVAQAAAQEEGLFDEELSSDDDEEEDVDDSELDALEASLAEAAVK